jgi:hypothetical protein
MSKTALLFCVFAASFAWPVAGLSQTSDGQNIPDFSGGWARIGGLVETFEAIPGFDGAGPILEDPLHPHAQGGVGQSLQWVPDLDNPILRPETAAKLQNIRDAELEGIPHVKDEGMCFPSGVPMILNRRGGGPVQILQTPTQITILNGRDQQIRKIYLNVPHTDDPGHSWYGESVGHYEGGDTLVVDTIGQNDKTQIDRFGTTHSDTIHVVERYRLSPDGGEFEVQFTVTDLEAFTMPWSGRTRFRQRDGSWDEQICAENNRHIGLVTVRGVRTEDVPTASDDTLDF